MGFTWTGTVAFGSQRSELDFVFDTGSDWVVVETSQCANCEKDPANDVYDVSKSTTVKTVGTAISERAYGTAKL